MDELRALDLSSAGMKAQRLRLQVVAENLANQHTTGPNGPYQRKDVVLRAAPLGSFSDSLQAAMGQDGPAVETVEVAGVVGDRSQPIRVYDPSHPQADAQGYVSMPNISIMREMADMMSASRSYEANLAASKATQEMIVASLDMVKR